MYIFEHNVLCTFVRRLTKSYEQDFMKTSNARSINIQQFTFRFIGHQHWKGVIEIY